MQSRKPLFPCIASHRMQTSAPSLQTFTDIAPALNHSAQTAVDIKSCTQIIAGSVAQDYGVDVLVAGLEIFERLFA